MASQSSTSASGFTSADNLVLKMLWFISCHAWNHYIPIMGTNLQQLSLNHPWPRQHSLSFLNKPHLTTPHLALQQGSWPPSPQQQALESRMSEMSLVMFLEGTKRSCELHEHCWVQTGMRRFVRLAGFRMGCRSEHINTDDICLQSWSAWQLYWLPTLHTWMIILFLCV